MVTQTPDAVASSPLKSTLDLFAICYRLGHKSDAERAFSRPRASGTQTLIRQRGRPSLCGHRKTALPEMASVTASAQVPVDQVKIRSRSSIGAERARHSLSGADILPADLHLDVRIWRSSYDIFIKRISCRAEIANGFNRRPNLRRAAEVADTREHCLPPIKPLLGAQGTLRRSRPANMPGVSAVRRWLCNLIGSEAILVPRCRQEPNH